MEIKTIKIKDLATNDGQIEGLPKNPRQIRDHRYEKLKKSIEDAPEMLQLRELLVYPHGGKFVIIGGNMRYRACKEIGYKELPCKVLDAETPVEKLRQYAIKDNENFGEYDWDEVANSWDTAEMEDWGVELPTDWGAELDGEGIEQKEIVEDEIPENVETKCKKGEIWQLGRHRLMCGDSTDADTVARLMDEKKADLVFTDPPYGIGIDGQKESKCANPKHNRKAHEFRGWDNTRPDKSVFDYILSLNIPSVIFGGNYFADMLPATRGWIYWSKGQDGLTMSDGELAWTNVDKPLRCVTVNRANLGKTVHPTQKPLKVVEFCLDYAGEGEVVLDLFGGSGSTLIACEQLNRTCYMMELDPHYCDVIIARWEKLSGGTAVKIEDV